MSYIESDGREQSRRSPGQPQSAAPPPRPATTATTPLSRSVRARKELTPQSLAERTMIEVDSPEAVVAERLLVRQRDASRGHAKLLADLAELWVDRDDADLRDGREEMDLVAAIALRTTTSYAGPLLRDAHIALTDLPETYAFLAAGVMPAEWFDRLVRSVRALTPYQRGHVDDRVATWDLASIPAESFRRNLRLLVAWFTTKEQQSTPEQSRDVTLEPSPEDDGTVCVTITGPIPELLSLTRRLDQSARAVQDEQRRALAAGAPAPFDPDGLAAESGKPLTLAALRYAILTRSVLDTGSIEVPAERFRINVLVPVMTLMGHSDAPATLDGIVPIPAAMARKLAARESPWYRILNDPHSGGFLPLPAEQYRPTTSQLEYLRLADPVCAVPGCDRLTSCNCEGDHIIAFDHAAPQLGGRTCVTNMHLLCRTHHRLKTLGLLDVTRRPGATTQPPARIPAPPPKRVPATTEAERRSAPPDAEREPPDAAHPPDTSHPPDTAPPPDAAGGLLTQWQVTKSLRIQVAANRDLLTPELATALQDAWDDHMFRQEIQALIDNGEFDRIAGDFEPIEPRDDDLYGMYDANGQPLEPRPPF